MAQYQKGNIWSVLYSPYVNSVLLITTNAVKSKDGRLVMGAGLALEAKKKYPWLPLKLGNLINKKEYNLIIFPFEEDSLCYLGALQTKYHWRNKSPGDLVARSVKALSDKAEVLPKFSFHCGMPGVGNGGLDFDFSKSLTTSCPDNVTFWTK